MFSLSKEAPLTKAYSLPVGARTDTKFSSDRRGPQSAKDLHASFRNLGSIPDIHAEDETKNNVTNQDTYKKTPPPPDPNQNTMLLERKHKDSASLRTGTERSLSDTAAVLWDLHQREHQMPSQSKENIMAASEVKINELPRTSFKASPLRNM